MKPNMIFVIIKGSIEEAEAATSHRGFHLYQASKSPKWNETMGYISMESEIDALVRVTRWMNEFAKLEETGGYSPGTLLWFAEAKGTFEPQAEEREVSNA